MAKKKQPKSSKQDSQSSSVTPLWITERDTNSSAPVFFWKPHEPWGFLGQWYSSNFREPPPEDCCDGPDCPQCEAERKAFTCCEQYMMYMKAKTFKDENMAKHILETDNPGEMKAMGRRIKGFNDYTWEQVRFDIVVQANLLKFGKEAGCRATSDDGFVYGRTGRQDDQQPVMLRDMLLSTGTRELVEASALDKIWGIGFSPEQAKEHGEEDRLKWGKNLLGKALMETRRRIRVEEGLEEETTAEYVG